MNLSKKTINFKKIEIMKKQKIVFGNLEGLEKKFTSKESEKLAELRFFAPCKNIDFSKFIAKENFSINEDLKKIEFSDLIQRVKIGCKDSFNILDLQIRANLKNISITMTKGKNNSLICDSVQDCLIKIYDSILIGAFDKVETKEHFLNLAANILKNIIFDIDRPQNKNNHYTKTRLFAVSESGECELNKIDQLGEKSTAFTFELSKTERLNNPKKLEISLNKLNEKLKAIIELYYFEGASHKEISEELEISVNSSMLRLSRAKKKLKEIYSKA